MLSKVSFFPVFLAALIGLGWMADQLKVPFFSFDSHHLMKDEFKVAIYDDSHREEESRQEEVRRSGVRLEMLELLDQWVRREWAYHHQFGRFTFLMSKLPDSPPQARSSEYEIRVIEAHAEHLLIGAYLEEKNGLSDQVLMNERYEAYANFLIPEPSFDHLRASALEYLKTLRSPPPGQLFFDEPTLFKKYFRYQISHDSHGQKVVKAFGLRPPVSGLVLEWSGEPQKSGVEGRALLDSPMNADLLIEKIQPNEDSSQARMNLSGRRLSSTAQPLEAPPTPHEPVMIIHFPSSPLVVEPVEAVAHKKR